MTDKHIGHNRRSFLVGTGAAAVAVGLPQAAAAATDAPADRQTGSVVVRPADARYQDLVRGTNQRWVGNPERVHVARSTADVVAAVQLAVDQGKRLTVQGGGHCYEDFVFNSDVQVVINLSELDQVAFDPAMRAFSVGGGATLLDVYEKLYRIWGVTIPAGQCATVGVGGHISGGGWGVLCRELGLSVDHLYAVEVVRVDANGKARAVIATSDAGDVNRELWWANTGGGGGNFGVVTRYWFRTKDATGADPVGLLPRPPAEVLLAAISWPWETLTKKDFATIAANFGDWHVRHAAPGKPESALFSYLNLNHQSNGQIGLLTQVSGNAKNPEKLYADFLADVTRGVTLRHGPLTNAMGEFAPAPEFEVPQRLPWLQATKYLGAANPILADPTLRGDFKSAFNRARYTDQQIAGWYKHLTRTDFHNPRAQLMVSSYGGKINSVGRSDTAFAHRDSAFKVLYLSYWNDKADDAANIRWLRDFYYESYGATGGVPVPDAVTDGCYLNYPDIDLNDPAYNRSGVPWHTLYYTDNYRRLQAAKAAYDPRNVFRHSQSVRLP